MYVIVKNDKLYFKCLAPGAIVLYTTELSEAHTFCENTDAFEFVKKHMSAFTKDLRFTAPNSRITVNEIQYDPLRINMVGDLIVFPNNEDDFSAYMNEPQESVEDVVNHPSHYETGKFECIEVMLEALGYDAVRDFCICNAFKYLYRHKRKNGYEDIKKAQWYLNKYIEITEDAKKNGLEGM